MLPLRPVVDENGVVNIPVVVPAVSWMLRRPTSKVSCSLSLNSAPTPAAVRVEVPGLRSSLRSACAYSLMPSSILYAP